MVSVKVFLMIQFEAMISRGRKFHLLGVFYFSSFYENVPENKKIISAFSTSQVCKITAYRIGMCHYSPLPKRKALSVE